MRIANYVPCLLLSWLMASNCLASESFFTNSSSHHTYIGVTEGYGSTTWGLLVPKDPGAALAVSAPIAVQESGNTWGFVLGYELAPTFAFEMDYTHYAPAKITFDADSLFAFEHNLTELTSHTESTSVKGKFMLLIPHTPLRAFSAAGLAAVHRYDKVRNHWLPTPTFSLGMNIGLGERLMAEWGFDYTAGYGQSELDPAIHFIPFLYSGFVRLAYRFS